MLKIAVDCSGGDNGSPIVVEAIKNFLKNNRDVEIFAYGKIEELQDLKDTCHLIDARDNVPMEAGPLEVMRLKNASMVRALKDMKEQHYDAAISAGSTGGFLSAATLILKNMEGVKRSALVTPFPTAIKGKKVVILDMGASNENSPEELEQFATMGSIYAQKVLGIKEPKVYLLSNGAEEGKGSPTVKATYHLLKEHQFPGFMGNIEARYALKGEADVIVCDGFTGNVFLKSSEGMAKLMSNMIKKSIKKNLWTMLGVLHIGKGLKEMSATLDYKSTGGAMLLGINGVVVKCHGSADAYTFESALKIAKSMAEAHVPELIKEGLKS